MKLKDFFETEDKFTEDELNIILDLLSITKDSLFDVGNDLLTCMEKSSANELKELSIDFDDNMNKLKVFTRFFNLFDDFVTKKKWGKN